MSCNISLSTIDLIPVLLLSLDSLIASLGLRLTGLIEVVALIVVRSVDVVVVVNGVVDKVVVIVVEDSYVLVVVDLAFLLYFLRKSL